MDLKNIQISDLKAKLESVDKKTLIKFGIGFGAIGPDCGYSHCQGKGWSRTVVTKCLSQCLRTKRRASIAKDNEGSSRSPLSRC